MASLHIQVCIHTSTLSFELEYCPIPVYQYLGLQGTIHKHLLRGVQKNIAKVYLHQAPPFRPQKNSGPPPFPPWKIWVHPIKRYVNLSFAGKICSDFFPRPPLQGSNISMAPFLHQVFVIGPWVYFFQLTFSLMHVWMVWFWVLLQSCHHRNETSDVLIS